MYENRYHLSVQNFQIAFKDDDQIIEPSEVGYVALVNIVNVGKMPTPIHTGFDLGVCENEHISRLTFFQIPNAM